MIDLKKFQEWGDKIEERSKYYGLDFYPVEFVVVPYEGIIDSIAYAGMPVRYPHWSFGKAWEKRNTLYKFGLGGIVYESVRNSDPAVAYICKRDTTGIALMTAAHVFAHVDFFKNNIHFSKSRPESATGRFRAHAEKIQGYIDDASIGEQKVKRVIDAAHSLMFHRKLFINIQKLTHEEKRCRIIEASLPRKNEWSHISPQKPNIRPDLNHIPLEPEEDILRFIADFGGFNDEWERDIMRIVADEADYFMPSLETKIMNEGWASFWHYRTITEMEHLPKDLYMEFIIGHNAIVSQKKGQISPYWLGFNIWKDIYDRWENPCAEDRKEFALKGGEGMKKIFQVRRVDRDISFLRQYLTPKLIQQLHLARYELAKDVYVVTDKSGYGEDHNKRIKQTLIRDTGINSIPDIKIIDADRDNNNILVLMHYFDGRTLLSEFVNGTLKHLHNLWKRPVRLITYNPDKKSCWVYQANRKGVKNSQHCRSRRCPIKRHMKDIGYKITETPPEYSMSLF